LELCLETYLDEYPLTKADDVRRAVGVLTVRSEYLAEQLAEEAEIQHKELLDNHAKSHRDEEE
jgi:hypothetical protein